MAKKRGCLKSEMASFIFITFFIIGGMPDQTYCGPFILPGCKTDKDSSEYMNVYG
jgi:hypothetical protein